MNQSQFTRIAAVSIGLLVLLLSRASVSEARSVNLPSPQCHPSIIQSMPPKIRKICDALSTIWEFSEAMENYLDEKGDFFYFNFAIKKKIGKIMNIFEFSRQKLILEFSRIFDAKIQIFFFFNFRRVNFFSNGLWKVRLAILSCP